MKHSDKDKFEAFFQDSLEQYQEDPSNEVWSELKHRIPPPPKSSKKLPFWFRKSWILLLPVLLIFIGFQLWKYENNLDTISDSIDQQEQKITQISDELNQVQKDISTESLIEKTNEKSVNQQSKVSAKNLTSTIKNNSEVFVKEKKSTNSNVVIDNKFSQKTYDRNTKEEPRNAISFSKNKKELVSKNSGDIFKKPVNRLDREKNRIEDSSPILKKNDTRKRKKITSFNKIPASSSLLNLQNRNLQIEFPDFKYLKQKKTSFEFFGNFSKIYPKIKIEEPGFQTLSTSSKNIDFGALYSIRLFKNWGIQVGVGLSKYENSINLVKSFQYADTETSLGDDVFRTNYNYFLDWNYEGKLDIKSTIDNSRSNTGQNYFAGNPFKANITLTRDQQYLIQPFFIKYFGNNSNPRFNWTFKTGFINRYSLNAEQNYNITFTSLPSSKLTHHNTEIIRFGNVISRRHDIEILIGSGAEFRLNRNITFILEPTFKKAIIAQGEVRPYTLGIYSGVRWNIQ